MYLVIIMLFLSPGLPSKAQVINLDQVQSKRGQVVSYYFDIDNKSIWVGERNDNYRLSLPDGKIIQKFITENNLSAPNVIYVADSLIITNSLIRGIRKLLLYHKSGRLLKQIKHHPHLDFVHYNPIDSTILVGGRHFTHYADLLDRYDEDSIRPSQYSINKFKEFFQDQEAYTLTKYDFNLNLIDSCNFIGRRGIDSDAYQLLWIEDVFDVDLNSNIYTIHQSDGYVIRKYSSDFKLTFEFRGSNPNFIPIPKKLNPSLVWRMNELANSYSIFNVIYMIQDKIIVAFHQNTGEDSHLPQPVYYDVYSLSGETLHSGVMPYRLVVKDHYGNLYIRHKKEGSWFFGKDKNYLVLVTLSDLLADRVTEKFVSEKIERYLNDND